MQQVVFEPTTPGITPDQKNIARRPYTVFVVALILFAVSGITTGFAFGAFVAPPKAKTLTTTNISTQPQVKTTPTAQVKQSTALTPQPLGCPVFDQYSELGTPDGQTPYSLTAHVVDRAGVDQKGFCVKNGQPIHTPDVTCKLWLSEIPEDKIVDVPQDVLANVANLPKPIKGEVVGGLQFDPTTPQTAKCDAQGQRTWKFTIAPSVQPKDYYLVVLTDWSGRYFRWSWRQLTVTKK